MKLLTLLFLTTLTVGLNAQENPRFIIYSSWKGSNTNCQRTVSHIVSEVVSLPHPDSTWIIAITCTKQDWDEVVQKYKVYNRGAFTLLKAKIVFYNGQIFTPGFDLNELTTELVIAHEIGHVILNTEDEGEANRWARKELKYLKEKYHK